MTPIRRRPLPLLALLTLPPGLCACGDDGGRGSTGATATGTATTVPTSVSGSESDTTPTTTASTTTTTAPTSGGPGSTSTSAATDATSDTGDSVTGTSTTGFPAGPGCSEDLHSVLDGMGGVLEVCPPDQGCFDAACVPACEAAAKYEGTIGCDFWAPTPPFLGNGNDSPLAGPCYAVFLANAWTSPANITVERGGQKFALAEYGRIPKTVGDKIMYEPIPPGGLPPDEVAILFLSHKPGTMNFNFSLECPVPPALLEDTAVANTGVGQAFHVVTDVPVSAYDINPYGGALSFLPSASLLFPASAWGTNYMAIAPASSGSTMFALIVAREDNTTIKVAPVSSLPGGGGQPPAPAGVTTQYQLDAGESLQWFDDAATFNPTSTVLDSDKPIGLWTGSSYMSVKSMTLGPGGGDSAHQQILPVKAVGSEYVGAGVVTRLANLGPESVPYRLVGAVAGTKLSWDPAPPQGAPTALEAGQVAQFETTSVFTVRSQDADHPFLFSQYLSGGSPDTRPGCTTQFMGISCGLGDEEWVSMLTSKQFQKRYVFFTDPTYGTTNLVVTRARSDGAFADVTLECLGVITGWMPVGDEGLYEYAHVELERSGVPVGNCGTSSHLATSDGPFGIVVWGTDLASSYGYPAGSDISKINAVTLPVPG